MAFCNHSRVKDLFQIGNLRGLPQSRSDGIAVVLANSENNESRRDGTRPLFSKKNLR